MIAERYLARTQKSAALNAEAKRSMPGGDTRSTAWFPPYPPYVAEGRGCELEDVDGNVYIELLNNYTSLVHGHAHPHVVAAIGEQLGRGASFAAPHELTKRLAAMLCERVDSLEQVRFANSGTEAVMMAVRVARAHTGRPLIAKAEGGYHGTWDDVFVGSSAGLTPGVGASTAVIPYNDLDGARAVLEPLRGQLAAVIVEPVQGSGLIVAEPDYLRGLLELAHDLGALFVLDEVIAFRLSIGGAQALLGVTPDLTTIGKIIGGGLPVGAFGGRADVMAVCDPSSAGFVPHQGTFNGNPATMAGGIASLELLPEEEYERLNALGERLREGIESLGLWANGVGSLVNVFPTSSPVRTNADYKAALATEQARLFHLACLNEGLFLATRGLMSMSTPMDEGVIDDVVVRLGRALEAVQAERPLEAPAAV